MGRAEKIELIRQLAHESGSQAVGLLLAILKSQTESDVAKIEVLRIMSIKTYSGKDHEQVGAEIMGLLRSSHIEEVRAYAALAMSGYVDMSGSFELLASIVIDEQEDLDIRHNALAALEHLGANKQNIELMNALSKDEELGTYTIEIVQKWGKEAK